MIIIQLDSEQLSGLIQNAFRKVITELPQAETSAQTDCWFDLTELCNYLPDKPAKPTVYGWVRNAIIPCHKGQKKLRFLKSEIDTWLMQGRKKTVSEIKAESNNYLKIQKKK